MKKIQEKLRYLPDSPGVYLMKDGKGDIIYIGKALSIKKRVKSYFSSTSNPKIMALVNSVRDIEYIVTDSQAEALILECNLIKKYHPRYNVRLRDDKKYPFIKVSSGAFPSISITRTLKMDGSKYYGPYTSAGAVRKTIKLMKKLFMLRGCRKEIKSSLRPCLYYDLGQCIGPCTGKITEEEYGELVHSARLFLEGRAEKLIAELRRRMKREGDALHFEKAAIIRDRVSALRRIFEEQKMVSSSGEDEDYIAFAVEGGWPASCKAHKRAAMTSIFKTKFGWVGIEKSDRGLIRIILPRRSKERVIKLLGGGKGSFCGDNLIRCVKKDLIAYLDGERICFDYPVDLRTLSLFVGKVLKIVKAIPHGKTRSYLWVAEKMGGRQFARSVGQALSKNPLPIVIPCHRVIKSDGSIGGFTGGTSLKRKLLAIEKVNA
jgi:O-6-methylguanine DNA methyltransferase